MQNFIKFRAVFFFLTLNVACQKNDTQRIKISEVAPWCILGFDTADRTPAQRIALIKELGLKKYGFNKGKGDFSTMKQEFKLAEENNIEITSVFLWLNAERDSIGKLSPANQELLQNISEVSQKPVIWVSFSDNFFKNLSEEASIKRSVEMIQFVKSKADELGCKLALYNHHGWFGNPYNQLKILEKLNDESLTMVYNFHHAHEYVDEFQDIAKKIQPYLSFVNLNGVKKEGPQILDIGKGDYELEMINTLLKEGYAGPWGILGHIKTEDVKVVLERNIAGLKMLNSKLGKK
ncbi:xylose isomerase-like TIM barrel [Kordia sp. SMS9]|uniref:sugar phosphate isomerase/epimerase family protein n=1 Tax=Kordia sp. SMS9 TaxID=2282170 RepID=UPI000E0DF709|nr:TIM barrel protein [Kordia sp. SMS9]AXG71255.1 xylose isomerase-like TIM barrel [Kordia sp. SMS9]